MRARYWTIQTGLAPQYGTIIRQKPMYSSIYAEIEPDREPENHVYLFQGAVWGFEPIEEQEERGEQA